MHDLESTNLWACIKALANSSGVKAAAVAYFTDNVIGIGPGDRLVVDASDEAIKMRQTDRELVTNLAEHGTKVYSCPGLHAKVMVFDGTAVIGSMNASQTSQKHKVEAAVITDDFDTVAAARTLIEQLAAQSAVVDEKFISRIAALKVVKSGHVMGSKKNPSLKISKPNHHTWLVGLHGVDDEKVSEEDSDIIEAGRAAAKVNMQEQSSDIRSFWITGSSNIRKAANVGDYTVQIWREHSISKTPASVYPPVPILGIDQREKRTWFFYEQWADIEKRAISWKVFQRIARRIGVSTKRRPITPRSIRLLTKQQAADIRAEWSK